MIHLYCGDGKGKTTAAVGLTARAAGHGQKVLFIQFLKNRNSGEVDALSLLPGVHIMRTDGSGKFTFQMDSKEKAEAAGQCIRLLKYAKEAAYRNENDMIVLDEAVTAVGRGMLPERELKAFVKEFDPRKELVMTGAVPEIWMIEAADYVTDMQKIKHPFDKGTAAREGVEY